MITQSLRATSKRHLITVGHIWHHWGSSVPVLSTMAEMKFISLKLNVSFRTWTKSITTKQPPFPVSCKFAHGWLCREVVSYVISPWDKWLCVGDYDFAVTFSALRDTCRPTLISTRSTFITRLHQRTYIYSVTASTGTVKISSDNQHDVWKWETAVTKMRALSAGEELCSSCV